MTQSQNRSRSPRFTRQADYRVMLLRANGEIGLVCLCSGRKQATKTARAVCDRHVKRLETHWQQIIRRPDRPKLIFLEVWDGTLTSGRWRLPSRNAFRFEFHDRARASQQTDDSQSQVILKSGSLVKCVLLRKKTRKGGWRAKIVDSTFEGPITNWQSIPRSCTAGDEVVLKVCSVSARSGNAQFAVADET
ncbi:hypothetical protein N9L06_00030 [Mariniblastus sp.]|nr:hypothetical protein [Mariniblastus sp.]